VHYGHDMSDIPSNAEILELLESCWYFHRWIGVLLRDFQRLSGLPCSPITTKIWTNFKLRRKEPPCCIVRRFFITTLLFINCL
jgi:hypothetical protein